jgi:hypothetical protein
MKWLGVTLALLGASAALVGVIYLRDRDPSDWLPPGPTVAHHDALAIAAAIGGTCPRECIVQALGHPRTDHWTERIEIPSATECVDINVRTFATDDVHGVSGVTRVGCDALPPANGG